MNYKQLRNQLKRDIKASPGKAAALGIGLCVGMYFWLPMLWGLLPASSASPNSEEMDQKTLFAKLGTSLEVTSSGTVEKPETPWHELVAAIEADPWMSRESLLSDDERNPFARLATEADEHRHQEEAAQLAAAAASLSADELGLELSSTTIGPTRSMAVINDQVYSVGELVESQHGFLVIAQIRPSQVYLQLNDQTFLLEIKHTLGN